MSDDIQRKAYRDNGNGKRKRGRPKGTTGKGRPKGSKNKFKRVIEIENLKICKKLISSKAPSLTERILEEESLLAFSDVRMLFEPGSWELVPPSELPDAVARAVASIQVIRKVIPMGDQEPVVEISYKYTFWPKGQALERISKHLGLYDKDNTQKQPPQINMYLEKAVVGVQAPQVVIGPANGYVDGDST